MNPVPDLRLDVVRDQPFREDGDYVLYWMIAQRRTRASHALQQAVHHAERLGKPLLVFEPLDCSYRWASDRLHTFVIEGMRDNRAALAEGPVGYLPYVEPSPGAGQGQLAALAERACVLVTDTHPAFRWPSLVARAARVVDARIEAVDGCGLVPLRLPDKDYKRAVDFRRYLHKNLSEILEHLPALDPLAEAALPPFAGVPDAITEAWPPADPDALLGPDGLAGLPIDHDVPPVPERPGGAVEAADRLHRFLRSRFSSYPERNHPDEDVASELSPWLHFGHIGAADVWQAVVDHEEWEIERMNPSCFAKQQGAWGASEAFEAFIEELLTWRELGHVMAFRDPDHDSYDGLPDWARETLEAHADDPREHLYSLDDLADARTDDPIWNAAQRQLRETGIIHNYLRMLWGKRVLAWRPDPRDAFDTLVELNNRYALDGRDPNSYSGIAWVFGRYDRAWGPEREIYGKIRYMTSQSTKRKLKLSDWLARWS